MTATERQNMLARIDSMLGLLQRVKNQLTNPTEDDPETTEYDLNRLRTAIYNFKKVQLPKITKYENKTTGTDGRALNQPQYIKRKT
jgi:hypothetical protein